VGSFPTTRSTICLVSSEVEPLVYTEVVGGSIPSPGTKITAVEAKWLA
jgi:hypothetical protein